MNNYKLILPALFLILGLSFFLNCDQPEPEKSEMPFSEESFIQLYAKAMILKNRVLADDKKEEAIVKLFKENGLTTEKYQKIEKHYKNNPEQWLKMLDKVEKAVQKMKEQ